MSPFKNSIWSHDERYDFDRSSLSAEDFKTISRLGMVDVAKKQVPPIPTLGLLAIHRAIKSLPDADAVTAAQVCTFLDSTLMIHGAGIPTLICMLAVESGGHYPPMDRKVASGMLAKNVISAADVRRLCGKVPMTFSEVYVAKVIPAWLESLIGRSPEEADNYWGNGGRDET